MYVQDYSVSAWSWADWCTHAPATPFRHCCQEKSPKRGLFLHCHGNTGWEAAFPTRQRCWASARGCQAVSALWAGAGPAVWHLGQPSSLTFVPATAMTFLVGLQALVLTATPGILWCGPEESTEAAQEGDRAVGPPCRDGGAPGGWPAASYVLCLHPDPPRVALWNGEQCIWKKNNQTKCNQKKKKKVFPSFWVCCARRLSKTGLSLK